MEDNGRCPECGEYRYWCRNLGCVDGLGEPEWVDPHDCGGYPGCTYCRQTYWVTFDEVTLRRVKVEPNEDGSFPVQPGYTYTLHAEGDEGSTTMWRLGSDEGGPNRLPPQPWFLD